MDKKKHKRVDFHMHSEYTALNRRLLQLCSFTQECSNDSSRQSSEQN